MSTAVSSLDKEAPAPGFYRDLNFDEYASWDAVNASTLKGFSRTPAHVYYDLQHGGKEQTASLELGWLLHVAVLEPARFEASYVVPPRVDRRTKEGKATWAQFQAENHDKEFIDADDLQKILSMKKALLSHETAGPFFSGRGINEVSLLWHDKEYALKCKARVDRVGFVNEWPVVGELKIAKNASEREFGRAVYIYGYDVAAVHYLKGLETLVPIPDGNPFRRLVFFVVEHEPPHCVACYELDDASLEEGAIKRGRYMRQWRECVSSGIWPGYHAGIDYVSLPAWAFKNYVLD